MVLSNSSANWDGRNTVSHPSIHTDNTHTRTPYFLTRFDATILLERLGVAKQHPQATTAGIMVPMFRDNGLHAAAVLWEAGPRRVAPPPCNMRAGFPAVLGHLI